jgi:hypothetical protein
MAESKVEKTVGMMVVMMGLLAVGKMGLTKVEKMVSRWVETMAC